ncbi:unnamed protein product [Lasius platythorax]|uniref:Uncharacterized protein n=1 Tax=Lasius platythorax TaxID=488582 RepID=A0AAV2N451_9HYME
MEATVIIAKTIKLPVTHSPRVIQDKYFTSTIVQKDGHLNYVDTDQKVLEIPGGYNYTDNNTIITVGRTPLPLKKIKRPPTKRPSTKRLSTEKPLGNQAYVSPVKNIIRIGEFKFTSTFPPLLRYYLPSKSQEDDYIDTEQKAL